MQPGLTTAGVFAAAQLRFVTISPRSAEDSLNVP